MTTYDLIILGSGIAGLAAARLAEKDNKSVLVVDKGRRLGGRVSTRRKNGFLFNHGAQFVTRGNRIFRVAGRCPKCGQPEGLAY